MHPAARHQALLRHLSRTGQASVAELAAALEVSDDTVRRDLNQLAARGLLVKNHGGALLADVHALAREAREQLLPDLKSALGRAVAAAVTAALPAGGTLMLDAGSTLLAVAQALPGPHTVITHSLDIAHALAGRSDIRLVLAGGEWDSRQRLFSGELTVDGIRRYRADLAILGACALHDRHGLTASEAGDASVKRAMIDCSEQHWLVTDHLKFQRCAPHAVAPLAAFARLFSDQAFACDPPLALRQTILPPADETRE